MQLNAVQVWSVKTPVYVNYYVNLKECHPHIGRLLVHIHKDTFLLRLIGMYPLPVIFRLRPETLLNEMCL